VKRIEIIIAGENEAEAAGYIMDTVTKLMMGCKNTEASMRMQTLMDENTDGIRIPEFLRAAAKRRLWPERRG